MRGAFRQLNSTLRVDSLSSPGMLRGRAAAFWPYGTMLGRPPIGATRRADQALTSPGLLRLLAAEAAGQFCVATAAVGSDFWVGTQRTCPAAGPVGWQLGVLIAGIACAAR